MNKGRLEAFTDAIIAIAATIMVLELHVPKVNTFNGLIEEWPTFLAYIVSFSFIYVVWYSHQSLFNKAKVVSMRTYALNGVWLFILSLIPFSTRWIGEAPNAAFPEFFYALNLFLWSLLFQIMDRQILRDNPGAKGDLSNSFSYRALLYGGYVLAMVCSFFSPILCLIVLTLTSILLTVRLFIVVKKNA